MDQTRNRVLEDKKKLEEMQKEWDQRYGPVTKKGAKDSGRVQLGMQKEIERKYRNQPLNEAERRELKMLSVHNKEASRVLRPSAGELAGRGIRAIPRLLFRGVGFVLGAAAAIVVGIAGIVGGRAARRQMGPASNYRNRQNFQVLPHNSVGGKSMQQIRRNFGNKKQQQQRVAPRQNNGLGL